jgi:tetratricopeptide (TPR) repeat protein
MEGLIQLRNEIAQVAETLKKAFEKGRRDGDRRSTEGKGEPEPRWKKVLLRCFIGINVVLLASWITFTIKPAWLSQLKGRFSSPPTTPVLQQHSPVSPAPAGTAPQRPQIATRTTPAAPEPQTLPRETTKSQPVTPSSVEKPHTITPPASLPATTQDQELDDYLEIGALYAQKGDYKKAEELFQKVITQSPSSAQALNNLGFIYLKQGKYDVAEKEFKEALRIDPASVLPYYNLACLYSRKEMEVEALIYLKRALTRDARVKVWAMTDEDFDGLRSDVVFQELLGISSPEG